MRYLREIGNNNVECLIKMNILYTIIILSKFILLGKRVFNSMKEFFQDFCPFSLR